MIEITCNDRLGKKVRVKCKYVLFRVPSVFPNTKFVSKERSACLTRVQTLTDHPYMPTTHRVHRPPITPTASTASISLPLSSGDDTIGDLKKLVAAQTGTKAEKIQLKKW